MHLSTNGDVKQRGMSVVSLLYAIVIGLVILQLGAKLIPNYIESYYISQSLKSLAQNTQLSELSPSEVRSKLSMNFTINDIDRVAQEAVNVARVDDKIVIRIEYTKRESFFANIDFLLSFHHYLDSSKPNECCTPP